MPFLRLRMMSEISIDMRANIVSNEVTKIKDFAGDSGMLRRGYSKSF